jgi:pimeloyl-ACP methyl ester carboxylesterase
MSLLHLPVPTSLTPSTKHYLIYFITGNPGYIGYYNTFLSTLSTLLSPWSSKNIAFTLYGQSLRGFEPTEDILQNGPFSLHSVIDHSFHTLSAQRIHAGPRAGEPFDGIILIGHSVGSYIALECLRLRLSTSTTTPLRPIGAILLFPTVTHIAQSASGVKISALFRIPNFPWLAHRAVQALFWPLSDGALRWAVGRVTGMPEGAAEVTAGFLRSGRGVWQALHLAREEMKMITEDRWDEDIWGIEHRDEEEKGEGKLVPKLVFYFGQNDHWVADHTRDALIKARAGDGESKTRPRMVIDQDGIPHGFCISKLSE